MLSLDSPDINLQNAYVGEKKKKTIQKNSLYTFEENFGKYL